MKSKAKTKTGQRLSLAILTPAIALLAASSARAVDYPSTILADHPVAYYRLEELPGATAATDSSPSLFDGTYIFNSVSSPLLGQAGIDTNSILFAPGSGPSDAGEVDIGYQPVLAPLAVDGAHGAAFSVELWAQANTQPTGGAYLVPLADSSPYGGTTPDSGGWNFYQTPGPNSAWCFDLRPNSFLVYSPVVLLQWTHLVATYDGANLTFYINGVSQGVTHDATFLANPGYDIYIGNGPNTGQTPFSGGVDEVAFYTNVLSAAQILNHYQVGTNSFRIGPVPAGVLSDPQSATNYSGTTASFTTQGSGTPPFGYQWYRGPVSPGDLLLNMTNASYSFVAHYPADDGATFEAVITNNYGSITTKVATLSVLTNVNLVTPPTSITRNLNSYAAFRVVANGALPISYQWSVSTDNGTTYNPLAGETADTLWLTNVQNSMNGNMYSVSIVNPFTSLSSAASLTVQPRAVTVPITGYAKFVVADHPVAYWRLDETNADGGTATDAVGTFDATYTDGSGSFSWDLPTGIPFETNGAVGITNGATVQVPYAAELNSDNAWSVETWIQPEVIDGNYRVVLSSQYNLYPNPYNGWYVYQQPSANFAFVPQPGNAFITANPDDPANGNLLVQGHWYHLVVTSDGTTFTVYINGEARTSYPVAASGFTANGAGINLDGTSGITAGLGNFIIGQRDDGSFGRFEGTVDETAVYNYALSARQVSTHYANRAFLKATLSGSTLMLSWPVGKLESSANVNGPYAPVNGATSPYPAPTTGPQQFFRVQTLP